MESTTDKYAWLKTGKPITQGYGRNRRRIGVREQAEILKRSLAYDKTCEMWIAQPSEVKEALVKYFQGLVDQLEYTAGNLDIIETKYTREEFIDALDDLGGAPSDLEDIMGHGFDLVTSLSNAALDAA